jgi:hypothetical protein
LNMKAICSFETNRILLLLLSSGLSFSSILNLQVVCFSETSGSPNYAPLQRDTRYS